MVRITINASMGAGLVYPDIDGFNAATILAARCVGDLHVQIRTKAADYITVDTMGPMNGLGSEVLFATCKERYTVGLGDFTQSEQ